MNLKTLIRIARRRWLSLILVPMLVIGAGVALTALTPRVYESETETFVTARLGDTNSDMVSGTTYAQAQVPSYMELVTSEVVLGPVASQLGASESPQEMAKRIGVDVVEGTAVMQIRAATGSPEGAARLARAVTEQFVDTVEGLETPSGGSTSNIEARVIREAQVPQAPSSPVAWRNILLSIVVGLALGLIVAFLRERADPVVRSSEEVEEITNLPVLGRIPNESKRAGRGLGGVAGTPRVEAFNTLRTNLQFIQTAGDSNAFVITSARAGEGKSSTVANLAASLNLSGQRVLVIEADLRRPRLGDYMGLTSRVGLTNVLVGNAALADVLQPFGEGNVMFLGAGALPPNPVELLSSQALADLLNQVRQHFDLVLIDAPPLLPVADAVILSQQAQNLILVTGLGVVERQDFARCRASLEPMEVKVAGVVLNRVPVADSASSYSYSYSYATDGPRARQIIGTQA